MARNKQLLQRRNAKVHELFRHYRKKNPKWQLVFVIEAVANDMYLTPLRIQRILKEPATVEAPANQMAMF
ncbi:hypothetical protein ABDK00_001570 [Niabella insulamsoli]|uniref:hypothetical protein n=1 Tax=Niabella insulamsoli TaxID=3144874 RepID=UPI0031FC7FE6